MFDGLRLPVERPVEPERSPEDEARQKRRRIVARHARALVSIFECFDNGHAADHGQVQEMPDARKDMNGLREPASTVLEHAYTTDPQLGSEATGGDVTRATPKSGG